MISVYLCGPMAGKTLEEAAEWRKYVARVLEPLGFRIISPIRGEEKNLVEDGKFTVDGEGRGTKNPVMHPKSIYTRDMFDIRQSDILLANLAGAPQSSTGSTFELGYAAALSIPILMVAEKGSVYEQHGITREAADVVFETLDEAVAYLAEIYTVHN